MSTEALSGKAFRRQVIGLSYWFSVPALVIMIVTLTSLLELTSAEWRWFFVTTAIYAVVITPIQAGIQTRFLQPIVAYLDDRARGERQQPLDERERIESQVHAAAIAAEDGVQDGVASVQVSGENQHVPGSPRAGAREWTSGVTPARCERQEQDDRRQDDGRFLGE